MARLSYSPADAVLRAPQWGSRSKLLAIFLASPLPLRPPPARRSRSGPGVRASKSTDDGASRPQPAGDAGKPRARKAGASGRKPLRDQPSDAVQRRPPVDEPR